LSLKIKFFPIGLRWLSFQSPVVIFIAARLGTVLVAMFVAAIGPDVAISIEGKAVGAPHGPAH
jgi:hypothetical protein